MNHRLASKFIYFLILLLFSNLGLCQGNDSSSFLKKYRLYVGVGLSVNEGSVAHFFEEQPPFLLNGMMGIENKQSGWGLRGRIQFEFNDNEHYRNYYLFNKGYLHVTKYIPSAFSYERRNAVEIYKNIYSSKTNGKQLYLGLGMSGRYLLTTKPQYLKYLYQQASATAFILFPVHWFWLELRGRLSWSDIYAQKPEDSGFIFLSAYYRFSPKKISFKPKNNP
jgi:hypothetical protein